MKKGLLSFIWKTSRLQLITIMASFLIGVLAFLYCWLFHSISFPDQWDTWLEAFVTFNIVILAIAIGYNELQEEWVKSLPKRLNASFYLISTDGKQPVKIMECLNAVLINESDIRAWGQQIGSQMADGEHLKFSLSIEISDLRIIENKHIYEVKMYLKLPPKNYGLEAQPFDPNKWIRWTFTDKLKPEEKFFDLVPEN